MGILIKKIRLFSVDYGMILSPSRALSIDSRRARDCKYW